MSIRRSAPSGSIDMQEKTDATRPLFKLDGSPAGENSALTWKDLNETEKSAASLGVDPDAWKPIAFMNDAHYSSLLKKNAIDDELAKRLEAYRVVSTSD